MIETFLGGFVSACNLAAAVFFLKFWRETRDPLFLTFAASFTMEALYRAAVLFQDHPSDANPWIYLFRLFAFLLILIAIVRKNYAKGSRGRV